MATNHISSWNDVAKTNHGKKNKSPCWYVSPYLLCKMKNMLQLQCDFVANATAQLEHISIAQE
jgi:hypothetical protein